jgi:hypothetical protein
MTIFPKFVPVIFLKGADLNLQGCKYEKCEYVFETTLQAECDNYKLNF